MGDSIRDNITFGGGRYGSGRQNVTRFELEHPFTGVGDFVQMVNTSKDRIDLIGRNQTPVIKDIEFGCYLPICVPPGETVPDFSKDILRAIYQSYIFHLRLNGQTIQFPVSFNINADRVRSPLWFAEFPTVISNCEMFVELTNRNAIYDNINTELFATIEFLLFTK